MSGVFGWVMFLCVASVLLFNLFCMYPRSWKDKKIILGVKSRKEFKEGETAEKIDTIVAGCHKQAVIITIVCFVIAALLLLVKGIVMQTFFWMLFIFIAIFAGMVPYIAGHKEMMNLKKALGLKSGENVSLVDLKVSGKVHTLKPLWVTIPNLAGFIPVIVALLFDLKLISFGGNRIAGSFITTIVIGTFWLMGLLITAFAFLMDNLKNEVISPDSDVNANYNRAKKKNAADLNTAFLWINVLYTVVMAFGFLLRYSDMLMMGGLLVYMVLMFVAVFVFIHYSKKIEARYLKETELVTDDDECWIAGMFYYNPKDKRMNVEKRAGVGSTVNFAHPGGKLVGIIAAGTIVMTFLSLIWVGLVESTPISLRAEDSKLICHQLRDEYVIPFDDIASAEYGDDITKHTVIRTAGVGMDTLLKGKFSVDGKGCTVFLNPQTKAFIRIVTKSGQTYYLGGLDAAETAAAMSALENR